MTMSETKKFLISVNAIYPGWKVDDPQTAVKAWHWVLEDYTITEAEKALKAYVKNPDPARSRYAPSASQITELIEKDRHRTGVDWDALLEELKD